MTVDPVPAIDPDELGSRARQQRSRNRAVRTGLAGVAAIVLVAGVTVVAVLASRAPQPVPAVALAPTGQTVAPSQPQTSGITTSPAASPTSADTGCPPADSLRWSEGALANGRHFGMVRHVDSEAIYLDPARMLGGRKAIRAAREDGAIGPHDGLEDPYYLRDPDSEVVRIPLDDDFTIAIIESVRYPEERTLTGTEFAQLYCPGADPSWMYAGPDGLAVNLEVHSGKATRAAEQYLP